MKELLILMFLVSCNQNSFERCLQSTQTPMKIKLKASREQDLLKLYNMALESELFINLDCSEY